MSKPIGKANGNGREKTPAVVAPPPPMPPLSEDEALAIANGAASSAYDFLVSRRSEDTDKLPAGRFWYTDGDVVDALEIAQHLAALKTFVLDHPGIGPSGAYAFMTRDVRRKRQRGVLVWGELPLPLRQAYAVFTSVLPPLVAEARREAKRIAEVEAVPAPPPPNRGIFKRNNKRISNRAKRVHLSHDQKGLEAR